MASIYKRKNKDGTSHWRVVVRIKGYPSVCNHFERKQEADDWAAEVERQIKQGQFKTERIKASKTFSDLVKRFLDSGAVEHHKSAEDTLRHITYWQTRFKDYALVHVNSELVAKERLYLQETPTLKNGRRGPATVNRYLASLSLLLSYACRELRWISENPCFTLVKLKEPRGRDRVLSADETARLLKASETSRSPYLKCILLLALTTGMRQGEILSLEWRQIDLSERLAHLSDSKNGRPRSVPLAESVIGELKKLHATRNVNKQLVFASKTAFGKIDIKKSWQQALKRAQITELRFHDLRHTFATLAARQGASNLQMASAMGHRSLEMLQRYTHLDAEHTRHLTENIDNQLAEKSNGQPS